MALTSTSGPMGGSKPLTEGNQGAFTMFMLWAFVVGPFLAFIIAAAYTTMRWDLGLVALVLVPNFVLYLVGGFGIGGGFHRLFTHRSFKAKRGLRIALAIAGTTAVEGPLDQWVADHRMHHEFTDCKGDPHSPWRYGDSFWGLAKGLFYAHWVWFTNRSKRASRARFAPDMLADRDLQLISRLFPVIALGSVLLPVGLVAAVAWSWSNVIFALLWSLGRMAFLHHITWSINSVCHVYGERPFTTKDGDRATNFWPLAILSFGESWHNLHHADQTCARHGVDKGQIDANARLIWIFERLGWAREWANRPARAHPALLFAKLPSMSTTQPSTHDGDDEILEILDAEGHVAGTMTRGEAEAANHHTPNVLIFIFTADGRVWAQLRPQAKKHFPGLWDISACGGIMAGEAPLDAAHRELQEEMGLDAVLTHVETFINQFPGHDGQTFRRFSHLYIGTSDELPEPNLDVDEFKPWSVAALRADIGARPDAYVPSFLIELDKAVAARQLQTL